MFQQKLIVSNNIHKELIRHLELLFSIVPINEPLYSFGRPPCSKTALLNALIYKNIRTIPTLLDLTRELYFNPAITQLCGFKSFPSVERFSFFLRDTPHSFFQDIRNSLVRQLVSAGEISGTVISCDSSPVFIKAKENNLKTTVKERYLKTKSLKRDPDARLGAYTVFPNQKKVNFFWGYRNHILNDAKSELPVFEITQPNSIGDSSVFIPILTKFSNRFDFIIKAVIADKAYDSYRNIDFVVNSLLAKPVISKNPRNPKNQFVNLSTSPPTCIAGFPMASRGVFFDKAHSRWRHKFVCPIKGSKKFAKQYGWFCPWNNPKFFNNHYGCCVNLRVDIDNTARNSIDYYSAEFKELYNLRTTSERIFSRLLSISMQHPTVFGLNAVSNHCSIAHITVLAVALLAVKTNNRDKIRFIKSFIPNL